MKLHMLLPMLLAAFPAWAVSFDRDLPPDAMQASVVAQGRKVAAEELLAAAFPGYGAATHRAGATEVRAAQFAPSGNEVLAAVKSAQKDESGLNWRIEALLLTREGLGWRVLSRLPLESGHQDDSSGHHDDATLAGFDDAPFQMTPRLRAFGVRLHAFSSGSGAATKRLVNHLCVSENGQLREVLAFVPREEEVEVAPASAAPNAEMGVTVTKIERSLRVLPSRTEGRFDWQVRETLRRTIDDAPALPERRSIIHRWRNGAYAAP